MKIRTRLVFWAGFLTRFLTGQGLVLATGGFLTAGLDITDVTDVTVRNQLSNIGVSNNILALEFPIIS
jgi:hypothetical protein